MKHLITTNFIYEKVCVCRRLLCFMYRVRFFRALCVIVFFQWSTCKHIEKYVQLTNIWIRDQSSVPCELMVRAEVPGECENSLVTTCYQYMKWRKNTWSWYFIQCILPTDACPSVRLLHFALFPFHFHIKYTYYYSRLKCEAVSPIDWNNMMVHVLMHEVRFFSVKLSL